MRNILGDIQDHITVARVHPERIGSLRQERVRRAGVLRRGMHRFRSECSPMFRYSSLATSGEVFILLFLLPLLPLLFLLVVLLFLPRELRHVVLFARAKEGGNRLS